MISCVASNSTEFVLPISVAIISETKPTFTKTIDETGFAIITDVPAGRPDPVAGGRVTVPDDVTKYRKL